MPQIAPTLEALCKKKGLDPRVFTHTPGLNVESSLVQHEAFVHEHVLSKPYPDHAPSKEPRPLHGIRHVKRVADSVPVWLNLYRYFSKGEFLNLTEEDMKLLQIAMLWHDTAREGDEDDEWNEESALLAYHYLTKVLVVPEEKARLLAAALVNKDATNNEYKVLTQVGDELAWVVEERTVKNPYEIIAHDTDCMDIIRARSQFEAKYLDFFNLVAQSNPQAMYCMGLLLTEARSIIFRQGDGPTKHPDSQQTTQMDYCPTLHPLFTSLQTLQSLEELDLFFANFEQSKSLPQKMLHQGLVLARAIYLPAAKRAKPESTRREQKEKESLGHLELRKVYRYPGIPTDALKNALEKDGNDNRSTSLIGYGVMPCDRAGFLIFEPDPEKVIEVNFENIFSGSGKKTEYAKNREQSIKDEAYFEQRIELWNKLVQFIQMGGNNEGDHNEIIYHIHRYDAIFYTNEKPQRHRHLAALEAIYLQFTYSDFLKSDKFQFIKDQYRAIHEGQELDLPPTLPIFKYSAINNTLDEAEFTTEEIITMWVELCTENVEDKWLCDSLSEEQLRQFKIESLYGKTTLHPTIKAHGSIDDNYPPPMKEEIDRRILEILATKKEEKLSSLRSQGTLLNQASFHKFYREQPGILQDPAIQQKLRAELHTIWERRHDLPITLCVPPEHILTPLDNSVICPVLDSYHIMHNFAQQLQIPTLVEEIEQTVVKKLQELLEDATTPNSSFFNKMKLFIASHISFKLPISPDYEAPVCRLIQEKANSDTIDDTFLKNLEFFIRYLNSIAYPVTQIKAAWEASMSSITRSLARKSNWIVGAVRFFLGVSRELKSPISSQKDCVISLLTGQTGRTSYITKEWIALLKEFNLLDETCFEILFKTFCDSYPNEKDFSNPLKRFKQLEERIKSIQHLLGESSSFSKAFSTKFPARLQCLDEAIDYQLHPLYIETAHAQQGYDLYVLSVEPSEEQEEPTEFIEKTLRNLGATLNPHAPIVVKLGHQYYVYGDSEGHSWRVTELDSQVVDPYVTHFSTNFTLLKPPFSAELCKHIVLRKGHTEIGLVDVSTGNSPIFDFMMDYNDSYASEFTRKIQSLYTSVRVNGIQQAYQTFCQYRSQFPHEPLTPSEQQTLFGFFLKHPDLVNSPSAFQSLIKHCFEHPSLSLYRKLSKDTLNLFFPFERQFADLITSVIRKDESLRTPIAQCTYTFLIEEYTKQYKNKDSLDLLSSEDEDPGITILETLHRINLNLDTLFNEEQIHAMSQSIQGIGSYTTTNYNPRFYGDADVTTKIHPSEIMELQLS